MLLDKLQSELQEIAEAIMSVTLLDVTILNRNLKRIAGTGKYRQQVGKYAPKFSVFEKSINTGLQYVIDKPRVCDECSQCLGKENCQEEAEVCYPIKLDNEVVGVIGMIAFTKKQKNSFLNNQGNYMNFVHRMSRLITARLREQSLYEELCYRSIELRTIIDAVDEGIIAVDHNGKTLCINRWAKEILGIKEEDAAGKNIDDILNKNSITKVLKTKKEIKEQEEILDVNNNRYRFLLSAKPIIFNSENTGAVATFKDFNKLHRSILKISEKPGSMTFDEILGISPSFLKVKEQARQIASQEVTVMLLGESGTGKELFARAIHYESPRKNEVFLPINCGAIPDSLMESEFFGYEKGAFTGADPKGKIGKLEIAHGGTILLDEIGDLPLHMQVKLLRVIQDKEIVRVGGNKPIKIDIRILAATNKDLWEMVKKGEFREDLFYRLNVVPIHIPPLRERPEDILLMAEEFLDRYSNIYNKNIKNISDEVKNALINYSWPGNVRELENLIEYGVIFEKTTILSLETISKKMISKEKPYLAKKGLKELVREYEGKIIRNLIDIYGNDTESKKKIAEHLKISQATFYRKLKEHDYQI